MNQPKISEVLHLAADKFLWDGWGWTERNIGKSEYSCDAIWQAIASYPFGADKDGYNKRIRHGLRNLGLHPDSLYAFDEFRSSQERQAIRYAWLKFCAMMAEEQGV